MGIYIKMISSNKEGQATLCWEVTLKQRSEEWVGYLGKEQMEEYSWRRNMCKEIMTKGNRASTTLELWYSKHTGIKSWRI